MVFRIVIWFGIQAGIDQFSASARMNQYEKGKHSPDLTTVARLCKVLNVPVGNAKLKTHNW
jgi:transcriptional regulator with XRE-family HTH domain